MAGVEGGVWIEHKGLGGQESYYKAWGGEWAKGVKVIDAEHKKWNESLLDKLFTPEEKECIKGIPLVFPLQQDELYWWPNKEGEYTVKSGYWVGVLGTHHVMMDEMESRLWQLIWSLDAPLKLKHFLLRACNGSLPVHEKFRRRHIRDNAVCTIFCAEVETVTHALFVCSKAKEIWESSHLYELTHKAPEDDFGVILCRVAARGEKEGLTTFTSLAWACWFCKNKTVHEDQHFVPTMVAAGLCALWRITGCTPNRFLGMESIRGGVIKINTDVVVVEATGVRLGVAARDARGELLCMAARTVAATWDPDVAEGAAAWMGVELAIQMGWKKVRLEMDALNIVSKISKAVKKPSPLFAFFNRILDTIKSLELFKCTHVARVGNVVTHGITHIYPDGGERVVCNNSEFPPHIKELVDLDRS
ncbi:hypothetical protein RDABS01_011700 [Bienertia sinuspersici]